MKSYSSPILSEYQRNLRLAFAAMALLTVMTVWPMSGQAAQVTVTFYGQVDNIANEDQTIFVVGDYVQGSFTYDSSALESVAFPGNYFGAMQNLEVGIIQDSTGFYYPQFSGASGDLFVGGSEFGAYVGPPPGGGLAKTLI